MSNELKLFEQRIMDLARELPGMPAKQILLGKMVRHLNNGTLDRLNRALSPFGLHWGTWYVLISLHSAPEMKFTPSDMSDVLNVTRTNATRLLDELEQRGLITRVQCTEDRRKVFLALTPAASELIEQVIPVAWQFHVDTWSPLSPGEMQLFEEMLRKLLDKIEND